MLLKSNHINKVVSSVLLLMLLFIHSVKLLHSHSPGHLPADHSTSGYVIEKASADCSICSYHLTKDSDEVVCHQYKNFSTVDTQYSASLVLAHIFSFHSAFEGRGPPVVA